MFNQGFTTMRAPTGRQATSGGLGFQDPTSSMTLYAGVDPADCSRILVRKLVQVSPSTYGYEETRMTPGEKGPTYHSTLFRLKDFDLKEEVSPHELQMRGSFRALPNVVGFSLFSRFDKDGLNNVTVVENSIYKATGQGWLEWFQDFKDRRDIASYISKQYSSN